MNFELVPASFQIEIQEIYLPLFNWLLWQRLYEISAHITLCFY